MKHGTYAGYLAAGMSEQPQQALLTAWECLGRYQEDLVLIGGLAIRYLTQPPKGGQPGPVTLDVDFGISIGAESGQYAGIQQTLSADGFTWDGKRFKRSMTGGDLFIDLLTDKDQGQMGTVMVDDGLPVSLIPGVHRALHCNRILRIEGKNLIGAPRAQDVRLAEVGPLLVLKLNAFGGPQGRQAPKDAHDILYLAMNYKEGLDKALEGFVGEKSAGNSGMAFALNSLKTYFQAADSPGPMSCAAFRMNNQHLDRERRDESMRIREQCVTLAQALLKE